MDASSGSSSEGGAPDSGADTAAADALGGMDAAGDSGDGGGTNGYDGAIGYDGATGCGSAAVLFSADIMPIFQRGCTLSSVCHGQMNNAPEENVYLGLNSGAGGSAESPSSVRIFSIGNPKLSAPTMASTVQVPVPRSWVADET